MKDPQSNTFNDLLYGFEGQRYSAESDAMDFANPVNVDLYPFRLKQGNNIQLFRNNLLRILLKNSGVTPM